MAEYEPITKPVLIRAKASMRDPNVDLADGQPKRDAKGQAKTKGSK